MCALSMFIGAEIQFASVFVWSEIQSATLFHRAIVMLQLLELTSRGFAIIYGFRHAGRSANQRPKHAQHWQKQLRTASFRH